jgi:uncharacterized protein (DUF1778 family)
VVVAVQVIQWLLIRLRLVAVRVVAVMVQHHQTLAVQATHQAHRQVKATTVAQVTTQPHQAAVAVVQVRQVQTQTILETATAVLVHNICRFIMQVAVAVAATILLAQAVMVAVVQVESVRLMPQQAQQTQVVAVAVQETQV